MKLKNIIKTSALAALMVVGITSCEDMLKVDSKTYMFDYQNTLDDPTDTVYSVLGVINKLQKIADRSVILGELRGDLVKITDHASDDLRELYGYDFRKLRSTNRFDQAVDYYAVINNCNFFLAHADTTLIRDQKNVMKGEYITVLCYRAWAYLQLAQAYGEVPYKAIDSDPAASGPKVNIKELAMLLLQDFKDEYITYYDKYRPNYGEIGGEKLGNGGTGAKHQTSEMFIPVRLILGDLCLWAEDYAHAALYYHDYLAGDNRAVTTGTYNVSWLTYDFLYTGSDRYSSNTFGSDGYLAYIPMEPDKYNGTVSELKEIFNSTKNNDYWNELTRSQAITALSARQNYCYHAKVDPDNRYTWPEYMKNKHDQENVLLRGDLRLAAVMRTETDFLTEEEMTYASRLNDECQTLNKINSEKIWLYRKDVVYLRLAEALNRCGLPNTAFAILKEGLCKETIDSLSQAEKNKAKNIDGVDISEVYRFNQSSFRPAESTWDYATATSGNTSERVYSVSWTSNGNTMGIHSRGCGNAAIDTLYTISKKLAKMKAAGELTGNADVDTIRAVEEYLIDEMALETCFEGYRFGDLMRIAMHRAADQGSSGYGGFAENEFLAKRVAARETASIEDNEDFYQNKDNTLYQELLGADGKSLNKSWFLVLPDEK